MTSELSKIVENIDIKNTFKSRFGKALCLGIGLYSARILYCNIHRRYNKYPPGPNGIPVIGSLLSCLNIPKYASYLSSYGAISMIYVGYQPFVFLHSIELINEVFKNKNALDRGLDNSLLYKHLKPAEFNIADVSHKYWAKKRKIFQSVMIARLDSNFINTAHNNSLQHVFKVINACISNNELFHFDQYSAYIQFNSIWNAVFGSFLPFNSKQQNKIINFIDAGFDAAGQDTVLGYLGLKNIFPKRYLDSMFNELKQFEDYIEIQLYEQLGYDEKVFDINDNKWTKYFNEIQRDRNTCVASKLLAVHRHNSASEFSTKRAILQELMIFFGAGVDTTRNTSEYGIILLAKQPEIQEKIYNELKLHIGNDWKFEKIEFSQIITKLNYLRAFIYELVRISSVLAMGVPHYNEENDIWLENGKYKIPKKSVIICDMPTVNRNDSYWIKKTNGHPMKICLDSWLNSKNNFAYNLNKDKMIGFGVGPRQCAGKAMALRSLYLLFIKLMVNYKFVLQQEDENIEIKQKFSYLFVMSPKIGVIVSKRN